MPNWVGNDIIVSGRKAEIDKLFSEVIVQRRDEYTNELDDYFDFNRIIPMPPHQPDTSKPNPFWGAGHDLSSEDKDKYGKNNWYDWSVEHWGTKWNASPDQIISRPYREGGTGRISFSTAWSPPGSIFDELSKQYPTLTFDIKSMDESGYGEKYTLKKGTVSNLKEIQDEWED